MPDLIERARYRIGAALAPHPGRHTRGAPRVRPYAPLPYTPAPEPYDVPPQTASPVRPYVLHEAHRARRHTDHSEAERARADRDRLGVAVLLDIAASTDQTPAARALEGVSS